MVTTGHFGTHLGTNFATLDWFQGLYTLQVDRLKWLSEQMECGNLQIGKTAVPLWIPMTQKLLIPHLKALNVSFNLRYHTSKNVRLIDF